MFLGEVNEKKRNVVEKILEAIDFPNFKIESDRIQMLRDIIVLRIKDNETLNNLQSDLVDKLIDQGFKIEKRKYRPHITLVRKSNRIINFKFELNEMVNEVTLFSSERIDGRLVYKNKFAVKLKKCLNYFRQ